MSQKLPRECTEEPPRMTSERGKKNLKLHPVVDTKQKENVIHRLVDLFQESFDLDLIQSVAQTCQWDLGKSTEALIVLGGSTQPTSRRSRRINSLMEPSPRYKTKSLPSTLKGNKNQSGRLSDSSTHSMPNGLRAHPAYVSSDSLAGGQVWQRHYKSKPQSPGLLTMIPPMSKEAIKLQKPASSRSSSRPTSRPSSRASSIRELPEVKQTSAVILRIQQLVQNNVKVMVLMRGVPGSGKTHLAQVVVGMVTENNASQHILSTDDYFLMMGRGTYAFDSSELPQAHNWNQKRVSEALRRATNPIVVDNTHTQAWEMRPYVTMAVQQGYLIEVLEPVTPWKSKEAELARRNVHNVPREKIRQMLDRYEPGWTGDKLLNLFQLKYQHCGAAHVSPKVTGFTDSPLAQHRQHAVLEQPEKPRRKKGSSNKKERRPDGLTSQTASPAKKDRRQVPGVDINVTQEQQLEELNKLFAEYGKTMDPESRQKVLDAGVPIFEVVSRIRKLQGTLLPMPSVPPAISEEGPGPTPQASAAPDYLGLHRNSPTDSVEPDTMSSSNVSETSECDSDSEEEPIRRYLDDCVGRFIDGEDEWDDEEEAKSDGAVGGRPSGKMSALVTSSQEELSIIDYQLSTPAGSSMDELSLLDLERPPTPTGSSSSSEEPKTELSTLQSHSSREQVGEGGDTSGTEAENRNHSIVQQTALAIVDINDSLLEILRQRRSAQEDSPPTPPKPTVKPVKPEIPVKGEHLKAKSSKSPDLEQIPLPCIPEVDDNVVEHGVTKLKPCKLETIEEVLSNMASPPEICSIPEGKEKSPVGILKVFDLSWASIPFTGSWDKLPPPETPQPLRSTNCKNIDKQTFVRPADFQLWKENGEQAIILECKPRMINSADVPVPVRSKNEVAMFDKSSMTVEESTVDEVVENALIDLMPMFPEVPAAVLADLLEKCQGDKLWVADILLDPTFTFEDIESPSQDSLSGNAQEVPVDPKLESMISDGKKTIKRRKDKKSGASELSLLLKKEIEESFQIGAEHYTDNVLFIKKLRNGEINFDEPAQEKPEPPPEDVPVEPQLISLPTDDSDVEEDTVPMPLNPVFLRSLIERFGTPSANVADSVQGCIPIISVPESLARQLYWLWVETVNQQVAEMIVNYESQVTEDELLATALQDLELSEQPPNLQEIMDMEIARSISMKEQQSMNGVDWKRGGDETAASRLARQLLLEAYPSVGKDTLIQFYRNEGRSLRRTLEVLTKVYGPPQAASSADSNAQCHIKNAQVPGGEKPIVVVSETSKNRRASDVLVIDPSAFRLEIQNLFERRQFYRAQGQEANQKKNHSVAASYFAMAREVSEKIHYKTKTCIPVEFFSGSKKLSTTIDLHFLLVHEALQVIDLFLDHHIANLQAGRAELLLITGRGLRSRDGRSRIKPVIEKRLRERRLGYADDNPGMLRVTVHPNDLLSSAL